MDNESKITVSMIHQLLHESQKEVKNISYQTADGVRSHYNITEEMEKISKNRNWRILFLVCVVLISFAVFTSFMNFNFRKQHYNHRSLDIQIFRSIGLRELLRLLSEQFEEELASSRARLESLTTQMEKEISELENKISLSRRQLKRLELSKSAQELRNLELKNQYVEQLRVIQAEYEPRIAEQELTINQISNIIDEFSITEVSVDFLIAGDRVMDIRKYVSAKLEEVVMFAIQEENRIVNEKREKLDNVNQQFLQQLDVMEEQLTYDEFQVKLLTLQEQQKLSIFDISKKYDAKINQLVSLITRLQDLIKKFRKN